jgi:hypothetical protein
VFAIVIVVDVDALSALAAVNVTVTLPACANPGVQLSVPVVLPEPGVKVAPAGNPVAESDTIVSASGSDAVTFTVSGLPSAPLAVAGALTSGA